MNHLSGAAIAGCVSLLFATNGPARASEADCEPVGVIIMNASAASAEVKVDGETLFMGPITLTDPALGISARREACLVRGKALVETLADGAGRSETVMIRRTTRFIYIDMGRSFHVQATDRPLLLD